LQALKEGIFGRSFFKYFYKIFLMSWNT